jgi:periplasmic protein CpxP/Spy
MTEINSKQPANWRRRIGISVVALAAIAAADFGLVATAHSAGNGDKAPMEDMGGPGGKGGPGGHGFMGRMGAEFMEFRMNRMLGKIGASDEQKEKILAIAEKTRDTLQAERKNSGDMRKQMMEILKAPTIDRAAVEKLRTEQTARMDASSKIIADAVVEAAEVLTPEQRVKLADEMPGHRPRW